MQECAFLESIRHPHIVQYLGVTTDPESRLPVLLMELLDESLTNMLESSIKSLAYFVQVDICHDFALAVAYISTLMTSSTETSPAAMYSSWLRAELK